MVCLLDSWIVPYLVCDYSTLDALLCSFSSLVISRFNSAVSTVCQDSVNLCIDLLEGKTWIAFINHISTSVQKTSLVIYRTKISFLDAGEY